MGGWKSKFVFLLVVYFAGYATAVYTLTPPPENQTQTLDKSSLGSIAESSEFVQEFNDGLCKCVHFLKEVTENAALRLGQYIKQKLKERASE